MNKVDEKTPIWRNVAVLGWGFQIVVLVFVVVVGAVLVNNLLVQSSNQGINLSFNFVNQPASFPITGNDFRLSESVLTAVYEGVLNTLRVVIVGLVLATILGVAIGLGRLSRNFLLKAICTTYVEVIRNVPLLGILFFAYLAIVLQIFPSVKETVQVGGMVIINNRGFSVPWVTGPLVSVFAAVVAAGVAAFGVCRWRLWAAEQKDEPSHLWLWAGPTFLVVLFWVGFFGGAGFSSPSLDGLVVSGGMTMQPEYFALLFALVVYTSSHIGEIVRGSIQAVSKGQVEASQAMALNSWQRMRHVIFPQALRVAVLPLGNQYLNLMKNSSLGFAVSYYELTKVVSTSVGNRSPAVPAFVLLLAIYLVLSLIISALVNAANRKLGMVGR